MAKKLINSSAGFTLIEVMIALTIFGVFTTAYVVSQANNVNSSIEMQKNSILLSLCQNKMNRFNMYMVKGELFTKKIDPLRYQFD